MLRRSLSRTRIGLAAITLLVSLGGIAAATPASGQALALPTPKDFVAHLDLECFRTDPPGRPPVPSLVLSHLNPVLADVPRFQVTLGPRTQLCVPVAKNNQIPPDSVLDFVRFVDLSCYQVQGTDPVHAIPLTLSHLNPVLANLPRRKIEMIAPEQLCVPVIKNDVLPPTREIFNLIRFIDLACFRTTPPEPLNVTLQLTQLNPVLGHIPPTLVRVRENRQLCVPVRKDNQEIPPEVLNIVQWIDLEKFDIHPANQPPPIGLTLRHINPLFGNAPVEETRLVGREQLGVPVAKNGLFPPG